MVEVGGSESARQHTQRDAHTHTYTRAKTLMQTQFGSNDQPTRFISTNTLRSLELIGGSHQSDMTTFY